MNPQSGLTAEQADRRLRGLCDECGEPIGMNTIGLGVLIRPWGYLWCSRCAARRMGWEAPTQ